MRDFEKEKLKFAPAADTVAVIYGKKPEKSSGGILIAGAMEDKFPATGIIVAASPEAEEAGYPVGTVIMYHGYMAEDVPVDGEEVDIIPIHNILGKILL